MSRQLTRAKKTKVASKSRLNFGLPHDHFFSFRNSKYEFFDAVRPEQRIVLRAEKIAEMGELLQFRVDAVVNGKCVSEGELVLTKTPVQLGASSR
ncbi:MAG: hypothetical protein DME81_07865 [Verrucomicrobia bacterium]|nr:MAG: hypothetical protein DME81_07865 [Verrucomicrobiota bacterium]